MAQPNQETIHDLLVRNIPRGLVMGLEEAMLVGAQRAYAAARGMDDGHLPSVVGQLRHFHMNESFHRALTVEDASPSPLRSNQIVTGRAGILTLARFNTKDGVWNSGRRSATRKTDVPGECSNRAAGSIRTLFQLRGANSGGCLHRGLFCRIATQSTRYTCLHRNCCPR